MSMSDRNRFERRFRVGVGLLVFGAMAVLATVYVAAQGQQQDAGSPIMIQKQGSFAAGGTILGDPNARSLHCDHGYVDYQIPVNPRRINLVMWHSAAATAFLNRWDGGEGYQSIFLRRGFPVYIWDGTQDEQHGRHCDVRECRLRLSAG